MTKADIVTLEGVVEELLPDGRCRVRIDNDRLILAYTAGRMRKHHIRMVVGDRVRVEMSPYDVDTVRLTYREAVSSDGFVRGKRHH